LPDSLDGKGIDRCPADRWHSLGARVLHPSQQGRAFRIAWSQEQPVVATERVRLRLNIAEAGLGEGNVATQVHSSIPGAFRAVARRAMNV
jgi:hypothetical protein